MICITTGFKCLAPYNKDFLINYFILLGIVCKVSCKTIGVYQSSMKVDSNYNIDFFKKRLAMDSIEDVLNYVSSG